MKTLPAVLLFLSVAMTLSRLHSPISSPSIHTIGDCDDNNTSDCPRTVF